MPATLWGWYAGRHASQAGRDAVWVQVGAAVTGGTTWTPEHRLSVRLDAALMARLDAYCDQVNRSRSSAARQLIAIALRLFEEEVLHGQAQGPR